jgi:hypothetical protein
VTTVRLFGPEKSRSPVIAWVSRLDAITTRFRLAYNERCDRWDLRVGASDGEIIIAGQRIVTGWDMFSPYNDSRLAPGKLFVIDSNGTYDVLPGRFGWLERYWFAYQSPTDPVDDRDLLVTEAVSEPIPV